MATRILLATLLAVMIAATSFAQVKVNGVVEGKLWRTSNVSGDVEVFHMLGRTVLMPVKEAWVNIVDDRIYIGAKTDAPVLNGKSRDGYMTKHMGGKLSGEFPPEMQVLVRKDTYIYGEESELNVTMVATVILKDGAPVSVSFTSTEYAAFDVPAYITRLRAEGGFMAEQEAEDMKGFDSLGFRIRTYLAVFSKDSEKQASKPVTPKGWTIEPTYGGAWIVRDENGKDVAGDMSEYHATLRAKAAAKKIGLPEQELTRIHFDWE